MANEQLRSYNQEIQPKLRELQDMKDELKDYLDSHEKVLELRDNIKIEQAALASFLETEDTVKQLNADIKELSKEITLAIKGAARGTEYKPKQLKAYFVDRAKDKVVPLVDKGKLYEDLNNEIDN